MNAVYEDYFFVRRFFGVMIVKLMVFSSSRPAGRSTSQKREETKVVPAICGVEESITGRLKYKGRQEIPASSFGS